MTRSSKLPILAASLLAFATTCVGAPLETDADVYLKPDRSSAVLTTLPAGSTITPLVPDELKKEMLGELPPGWVAIRYDGPIYGYAQSTAIAKDLTLRPGSIVRAKPSESSTMLTMVGENDEAELIELAGDWSRVIFNKSMIGFVNTTPPMPEAPPVVEMSPQPTQSRVDPGAGTSAAPQRKPTTTDPSNAAVIDATPRVFQGYLMRTRRILGIGPRIDYQLVDENGRRIALLDLAALLITDPIERYENRAVSVFGPVSRTGDSKDMIIHVETLRLTN